MPDIAILLPSLRPTAALACVNAFRATQPDVDYEIVLVSPFVIVDAHTQWIEERTPRGVNAAMNLAHSAAIAPVVAFWADDARPAIGCLRAMLDALQATPGATLGAFRMRYPHGGEADQWAVYGQHYACFGAIRKTDADDAGGLFDERFRSYWADPDLALRVVSLGGLVRLVADAWVIIDQIDDELARTTNAARFTLDFKTFAQAWRPDEPAPENWKLINKPVSPVTLL
jgi:GT2 family glycosyltransferase